MLCISGFTSEGDESKESWGKVSEYFSHLGMTVYDCKWKSYTVPKAVSDITLSTLY